MLNIFAVKAIARKMHLLLGCFLVFTSASMHANSEVRDWKMADGTAITGEIASVDEEKQTVVLRNQEGREVMVGFDDLAKLDRAWLIEWIEMNEELAAKVGELGGTFQRYEGRGSKFTTPFYVYAPKSRAAATDAGPLMMCFCPSGKPIRYLLRHIEAAESGGITLVAADYFRNGVPSEQYEGRFEELHPLISEVTKHDPARFYLGGTSGGALCAFRLSARFQEIRIAGIYSNGGWLGPREGSRRPYQKMRVALVNGDKDHAANGYNDSVTEILHERECSVGIFAFEGTHQIPPPSVQAKSFRWLLGEFD